MILWCNPRNDAKKRCHVAFISRCRGEKNRRLAAAHTARRNYCLSRKIRFDGPILATTLAAVSAKPRQKEIGNSATGIASRCSKWADSWNPTSRKPEWILLRDDPRFTKKLAEARCQGTQTCRSVVSRIQVLPKLAECVAFIHIFVR